MEFLIPKTENTPSIKFEDGVLIISGRCIPENSISFFEPLFKFVADYSKKPYPMTEINIMLEYANSSTNRSLMTVFTLFEKVYENGSNVNINWYYETGDDLMADLGNDFKSLFRMPFILHEKVSLQ
jgi:predicted permease